MDIEFTNEQIETAKKDKKCLMVIGVTDPGGENLVLVNGPCTVESSRVVRNAIVEISRLE